MRLGLLPSQAKATAGVATLPVATEHAANECAVLYGNGTLYSSIHQQLVTVRHAITLAG